MLPFLGQRNSHCSQALQGSMRQNKSAIAPAFHPPLLCFFRTPDSLWGCLSEIRVDGSAALLGVARRGLSLYRVEVSIGCKVCLPFHLRVPYFLTQERAKLIENGFILMLRSIVEFLRRQTRAHHPGSPRTPPEISQIRAVKVLGACGRRAPLDRSLLGLFYDLLESGVFANLFVYSVLIAFAHVSRAKHHKAKYARLTV